MDRLSLNLHRLAPLIVVAIFLDVSTSQSVASAQQLMPPEIAASLGLIEAWSRPVHTPAGAQTIADMQLHVQKNQQREYVEIVGPPTAGAGESGEAGETPATGRVLGRIATDRAGQGSDLTGRAEAERIANNEIRRLKRRGITATINVRNAPVIRLYTLADNGVLECRDAETGESIWSSQVGQRRFLYRGMGISDDYITVLNGGSAILVDAINGQQVIAEPTRDAAMFGAISLGGYSIIPMIGGGMEGIKLNDPISEPFLEIVDGRALARPTIAQGAPIIAWPTSRGFVYFMEVEGDPSLLFRIETDGIVNSEITSASGNRFFFASDEGQIYGIRATRSGEVLWDIPYGEPFYSSPLIAADQLLIQSTYGNLISLNLLDGSQTWDRPAANIADLVGALDGKVFVMTLSGALSAVDLESGRRIGTYPQIRPARLLVNRLTDRMYLVSESGDVQCLRPIAAELPTLLEQPDTKQAKTKVAETGETGGDEKPFGLDSGPDPFGGDTSGDDPFGGTPPGGTNDPFGGTDDPFGAGGDPFGGSGDDPFGAAADDPFAP